MYVQRNKEARSFNHFFSGKTVIITYSECVFVALGTQHTLRMHHIVICGLSGFTTISHTIAQTAQFKKKLNIKCVF
jgi:hypothetical protein